jgi:hypothetical protein
MKRSGSGRLPKTVEEIRPQGERLQALFRAWELDAHYQTKRELRKRENIRWLASLPRQGITPREVQLGDAVVRATQASAERAPSGFLIDLLIPASRAEDMLLTLTDAFEDRWLPKYGYRRATFLFCVQSSGTVAGYWINWLKGHLDVFWKFFAS